MPVEQRNRLPPEEIPIRGKETNTDQILCKPICCRMAEICHPAVLINSKQKKEANHLQQGLKIDAATNSAVTCINGHMIEMSFAEEAHPEIYRRVKNILFSAFTPGSGQRNSGRSEKNMR